MTVIPAPVAGPDILIDIVDMQNDFILKDGACTHPTGAGLPLVPLFNRFVAQLTPAHARLALIKFDTHFVDEYRQSEEAKLFPNAHCVFGTPGQAATVDFGPLVTAIPTSYMNKNEFSMWGANPTDISKVKFASADEEAGYRNLFKVTPRFNDLEPGVPRDAWLKANNVVPGKTTIVVAGIYADYCTRDALKGYLDQGFNVIMLTDLTAGIGGNPERSGADLTGHIDQVCTQAFDKALLSGQLKKMTSDEFLARPAGKAAPLRMTA